MQPPDLSEHTMTSYLTRSSREANSRICVSVPPTSKPTANSMTLADMVKRSGARRAQEDRVIPFKIRAHLLSDVEALARDALGFACHHSMDILLHEQPNDSLRHGFRIALRDEKAGAPVDHLFGNPTDGGRDYRRAARPGFDHRVREGIRLGGVNIEIGGLIVAGDGRGFVLIRGRSDARRSDRFLRFYVAQCDEQHRPLLHE